MTLSKLIRRTLAAILFFLSTIILSLLLSFFDSKEAINFGFGAFYSSADLPFYVLIVYILTILVLILISIIFSQTNQFLVQSSNLDERAVSIRQQTKQNIFYPLIAITVGWILFHFANFNLNFMDDFTGGFEPYWSTFGVMFVIVPILTFPFVYGLWVDNETQLINPYFTLRSFSINVTRTLAVFLVIFSLFSYVSFLALGKESFLPNYYFEKTKLTISGDAKFRIILNSPEGMVHPVGNNANLSRFQATSFGDINMQDGKTLQYFPSKISYSLEAGIDSTGTGGEMHIFNDYRFPITDKIFGTPEIIIGIQKLQKLTITNANQVEISTYNGECFANSELEIIIQGLDNGLVKLPCSGNNSKINLINPLNQPVEYK